MDARIRKRDSHLWARDPDDWYVEPEWVSERLFAAENFSNPIWDPACGLGRVLNAAPGEKFGTDIVDRGYEGLFWVADFFTLDLHVPSIASNPPFKHAQAFADRALGRADKVALLLPLAWLAGDKRSRWLQTTPLKAVYVLTPRPSMPPGAVILAGEEPGGGEVDYAWFVWEHGHQGRYQGDWLRK